jgi:FMN-dependent NADH-azoreductase
MTSTDRFKKTIKTYLDERATSDELFAKSYTKQDKNITDCITYILNIVKASGINGYTDEEIYDMAVHYYDEDNIKIGDPVTSVKCVVNHTVELTEEEKEEARKAAIKKVQEEYEKKLLKKPTSTKGAKVIEEQPSLF